MILVTGAAGTVGSEVVKGLVAAGQTFRVGYRNRRPAAGEAVPLDFDRAETIPPALQGVTTVFLLSSLVTDEVQLVRAAKAAGVERIVKLSVWHAAHEAFSFARWHRQVEKEIEASGLGWTFLRPNGFMQNVVNYTGATIRKEGRFYLPAGQARVSHIDARDIGAVAVRTLLDGQHRGRAYELSGPESLSYAEIAATLTRALGRKIEHVDVPPEGWKRGAVDSGMPEFYADALLDLYRYYREGGASAVTPAVREVTGQDPVRFEQFARDYADELRP